MTTVEIFLDAIAQVESSDNPEAWGDGGRAMGRYQVHPDRLWSEAKRWRLEPKLGETWDQFVARVLTAMFEANAVAFQPEEIAMYWHEGHWVKPGGKDWDHLYDQKFMDALQRANGGKP